MNKLWDTAKLLTKTTLFAGIISCLAPSSMAQQSTQASFYCGTYKGLPATIVRHPAKGDVVMITWSSNYFGGNYSPQRRCEIVTQKFNLNAANGNLKFIISGSHKNLPVLCASLKYESSDIECNSRQVLFTLRPSDNAQEALKKLVNVNRPEGGVSDDNIIRQNPIFHVEGGGNIAIDVEVMKELLPRAQGQVRPRNQVPVTPRNQVPVIPSGGTNNNQCAWGCN
ncbi:MAG: hypothetical protein F6K21_13750 [Symploca sp. SIO2D2]|nr:hypothetical protein [Symploca sp. SIO2D2]